MSSVPGRTWTDNELRKEQVRATLALGGIAVVYYLTKAFEIPLEIYPPSNLCELFHWNVAKIDLGRPLVSWFGLYVLATIVAMSDDMMNRHLWREICKSAKAAGHLSYFVAVAIICLPVVLSTISLFMDSPILVGIILLIIVVSVYSRRRQE